MSENLLSKQIYNSRMGFSILLTSYIIAGRSGVIRRLPLLMSIWIREEPANLFVACVSHTPDNQPIRVLKYNIISQIVK